MRPLLSPRNSSLAKLRLGSVTFLLVSSLTVGLAGGCSENVLQCFESDSNCFCLWSDRDPEDMGIGTPVASCEIGPEYSVCCIQGDMSTPNDSNQAVCSCFSPDSECPQEYWEETSRCQGGPGSEGGPGSGNSSSGSGGSTSSSSSSSGSGGGCDPMVCTGSICTDGFCCFTFCDFGECVESCS